ncbi:nickel/cobalt ABC transporter permease [Cohnella thailandensis]|uniref:ABC transporter permease n=1 Tax=Cohnella thailandensis TaxID=557557 RepID=A0A841STX3_9BACL|nr:nickel/cobalt ABC transporter permease [Cohnella thailandensis]MBB6633350.1 ABC transporter permease [Cohnella thailandensis]MBP1977308.1 nickel transport system permease protein [Cohnella thailandensis]
MGRYIFKRGLISVPLLLVVSFLTFILNSLSPMDPAEVVLHAQGVPRITDELLEETRLALGLDRPLLVRYWNWFLSCLRLDFGDSYVTGKPVWSLLGPAFLNTLKLTMVSVVAIIILSIALGVLCALREGKLLDKSIRGISFVLTAMPSYLLASLLVLYFSVKLDLLPTNGMDTIGSYILPVTVITISYAGIYFRIVRSSMLSSLNEDYVLYGRACGLPERKITRRILRNSLQVAVSVFCMAIPIILGSTVVVENIFAWPGLGTLSVNSILSRDFPIIQAYVLILAASFVIVNTFSDMVNAWVNPKLREDG